VCCLLALALCARLTAAPKSQIVFTGLGQYGETIFAIAPDGTGLRQISTNTRNCFLPALSADGKKVVYAADTIAPSAPGDNTQIFIINSDGTGRKQLTSKGNNYDPAFSPDGKQVIYWSTRDGRQDLYLINADGGEDGKVSDTPAHEGSPSFSPDGKKILFQSDNDGEMAIYTVDIDGANLTRLTLDAGKAYEPAYSPDGRFIAFKRDEQIWIMDADGANAKQLTHATQPVYRPSFSPDGLQIVYQYGSFYSSRLYIMQADGRNPHDIRPGSPDGWSPRWGAYGGK
jgi:TolB protein